MEFIRDPQEYTIPKYKPFGRYKSSQVSNNKLRILVHIPLCRIDMRGEPQPQPVEPLVEPLGFGMFFMFFTIMATKPPHVYSIDDGWSTGSTSS